jgi:hypothetical protein
MLRIAVSFSNFIFVTPLPVVGTLSLIARPAYPTTAKGYINKTQQIDLFETARIHLEVPLRNNQKEETPVLPILKKIRKRIETVFSQLCDQFMIQRNYAKSFTGFKCRILAKVTGMTILQFLNKFIYNQPVGRVKHTLAN